MTGGGRKISGRTIALSGILTALGLVVLYAASAAPSGRLGLTAAAGLFPAAAVVSGGLGAGFLCYVATGLLAAVLLPAKDCVVLYALFLGLYPLVKHIVERLHRQVVEWALKLSVFNAALTLFVLVLRGSFFAAVPVEDLPLWGIYAGGNLVFVLYDIGVSKLMTFYAVRIDRALQKQPGR